MSWWSEHEILKKTIGNYSLTSSKALRSVPVTGDRDVPPLAIGECEVSKPSGIAVPDIVYAIPETTDSINAISIPVPDNRDIP
jgi:hypothetical protein